MNPDNQNNNANETDAKSNFIRNIIDSDIANNKNDARVHTRFPPEPNGYLHIGHAKSICLNFGIAKSYQGLTNLRFDDTNPSKEDTEYVDSIIEDVKWLGFDWDDRMFYASDYFQKLFDYAVQLIKMGKAFVCDMTPDQIKEYRGTHTQPGKESPYRNRSVEENLELFMKMKEGQFENGEKVLRAKIDMASPNFNMRDPVIYRILKMKHHRTADDWCIYPMYDFAHGLSDSIEGITHSICTLEFEDHRPLYDWFIEELGVFHPQQIEFARLNLTYTVMSKRKLLQLVNEGFVESWDDPRMPTISGLRRKGYTPASIRDFADRIGVAKKESTVDLALLEHCIRQDLNKTANRYMAVINPVKLIIDNYPEDQEDMLEAINNPEDPAAGTRTIPFSKELYIERDDFMENPPRKFFRLAPGREVRLRYAFFVTCTHVVKDDNENITEIHCTYDPLSRGGNSPDGRKVKATIHWVSAKHAQKAEVRLYENLFLTENPMQTEEGKDFLDNINPNSLKTIQAFIEPEMRKLPSASRVQFERIGYFCTDSKDSKPEAPVFNRTVTLRDAWAKSKKK